MLLLTLLLFIVIFSVVVLIHELGHFTAAKLTGVKVEEFGWGFPPRLWSKKFKGTLYSINALPIGGFVKLYGEEFNAPVADPKSFWNKKPAKKALVLGGGVVANVILGALLYYVLLATQSFTSSPIFLFEPYKFPFGQTVTYSTLITAVSSDSPAATAGILPGDLVTMVDNTALTTAEELNGAVAGKQGQSLVLTVKNLSTSQTRTVNATPYYDDQYHKTRFGVELGEVAFIKYPTTPQKILSGFMHSANVLIYTVRTLGSLISLSATSHSLSPVTDNVTGPVGIAAIVGTVVKASGPQVIRNLVELAALLSLALGISNILPIPAMDGGHLAFVAYEVVSRRKPNPKIQERLNRWGFYALIFLSILIAFKDVRNLFR